MTSKLKLAFCSVAFLLLVADACNSVAEQPPRDRITQPIINANISRLRGNVHPLARSTSDRGPVSPDFEIRRVTMMFRPAASQQQDLEALLQQQLDPKSPNFHQWLTPEEFGNRFGISRPDMEKVLAWLRAQGFTIASTPVSRTSITFSGTARQMSSAFHTQFHRYLVNGREHYANANEPAVPSAIAGLVLGFRSLNDFHPKPRLSRRVVRAQFTSNISGNHFLAPEDAAIIYNIKGLYDSGIDGTGQKIAVVGQTDVDMTDIDAFRSASNLPAKRPTVVLVPGSKDPGTVTNDIGEADLDLEWSGAIAKNATIVYVNSANGAFDSLQYAITANLAPVISVSYGDCEQNFSSTEMATLKALGQQANAQGITIVAATGDSGAADCDYSLNSSPITTATHGLAVDIPAAMPYVTGIGGTEFQEGGGTYWSTTNTAGGGSALSYIPEISWNDTIANSDFSASGGGKSILFSKPSWQTGQGVPDDAARDVPDIALNASANTDGYLGCSQGSCVNGFRDAQSYLTVFGGTSAGAPVFAGIVALINQKMNGPQGNVNPQLYSTYAASPGVFHDVTSGDNKVACTAGTTDCPNGGTIGYTAAAGYDQVTGLGSVDSTALATAWTGSPAPAPDFQIVASPTTLLIKRGATASDTLTVTALNGFTGSVSLTCSVSSTLGSTACSISPASVTSDGTATLTLTIPSQLAGLHTPSMPWHSRWLPSVGFAFAAGLILVPKRKWYARSSRVVAMVLSILAVGILTLTVACGGGGAKSSTSGSSVTTNPVNGTVTVQAVSGNLTHTVQVAVTVN